ncbi:hypothetical protein NYZ99_13905 [Maribacter litopenaei]|uniref:Uncharacterized protein n=1 Tax=Maribacter litopenaei TaxID=2976127 RepID=A0ABY5Y506_9FLAO|nr:hypothetical protein [Maribacter litopenaei]UWX54116.1 hypothetical protein NYZ99_13905 [Maribacter litopenaei]
MRIGLNLAKVQFGVRIERVGSIVQQGLRDENKLSYLVGEGIRKDTSYFKVSVDSLQNVANMFLEDFVGEQLMNQGIESDFAYTLFTKDSSYVLNSSKRFENSDNIESYPIELDGYFPIYWTAQLFWIFNLKTFTIIFWQS